MKKKQEAPTLSLKNLSEFEKWQNEYYKFNSDVSFTKADNSNINRYSVGAYEILNPMLRGGKRFETIQKYNKIDIQEYKNYQTIYPLNCQNSNYQRHLV